MAERTTILRAVVGSTAHGLALKDTDDRDEMGVCIEDLAACVGFSEFEQYIYRSAAEREGRQDAQSQAGDIDLTIYSLRKFLRLAMQGNPSVMLLLFVGDCVVRDALGQRLQELAPLIVSRQAGRRFLGYMESQRQRLLGERGQKKVNRPGLEERHGFDTKYAMHILRLGYQGVELLETGCLELPMPPAARTRLLAVRRGEVPLDDVLTEAGRLERDLKDLCHESLVRETPDRATVEEWMLGRYLDMWKANDRRWQHA